MPLWTVLPHTCFRGRSLYTMEWRTSIRTIASMLSRGITCSFVGNSGKSLNLLILWTKVTMMMVFVEIILLWSFTYKPCWEIFAGTQAIIKVSGHQYQWLAGGYDPEIGHTLRLEVASMVVTWWIVAFLCSDNHICNPIQECEGKKTGESDPWRLWSSPLRRECHSRIYCLRSLWPHRKQSL